MDLIKKLSRVKELGIKFPKYLEKECRKAIKKYPHRAHSINSTLDFTLKLARNIGGENLSLEFHENSGDADVKAYTDGKVLAFQIKTISLATKPHQLFYESVKILSDVMGYGRFLKATLVRHGDILIPVVHEYRRVSNLQYSCGVVYCPIDYFINEGVNKIEKALWESNNQLQKVKADYKIAVLDLRYALINEWDAYYYTFLRLPKYTSLNGAIIMAFDINTNENITQNWLIPITNIRNPIDWGTIFKSYKVPLPGGGRKLFFAMPIKIYIKKPGWQELFEVKPGYKIFYFYKGIYYGSL